MKDKSINNHTDKIDFSKVTTYQAGVLQAAMHRNLQKRCDTVLSRYGITKMHWLIIGTVLDTGEKGARLTDLAKTVGTTLPYLTTAINLLESKGMIVRKENDEDSRSKLISINEDFVTKCEEIEITLRQALRGTIYAKVDPAEFRIYMKVMYQLAAEG